MNLEKTLKELLKKIKLSESTISTLLGGLVIVVVGILIFNYFKSEQLPQIKPVEEISISQEEKEAGVKVVEIETEEGEKELVKVYKVKENDSLWSISEKFYNSGYYWVDISQANSLVSPDYLEAGQELTLPEEIAFQPEEEAIEVEAEVVETEQAISEDKYVVQEGDYLWQIAVRAYGDGYKWPEIAEENSLVYPDYLEVGQELSLPR